MRTKTMHLAACFTVSLATFGMAVLAVPFARAADPMGSTLCAVLKEVGPRVQTYQPEGARAQLVMGIADKYDADPTQLQQVQAQIDQLTTAECPNDREIMLGIVKMESLADAVR